MDDSRPKYWKVEFYPQEGENFSPDTYVKGIDRKDERAAIRRNLLQLELIKLPREWPNTKLMEHDGIRFWQVTVGRHRLYLYLDNADELNKIIVCYACPKKSNKTKLKDLNRVVASINKYNQ